MEKTQIMKKNVVVYLLFIYLFIHLFIYLFIYFDTSLQLFSKALPGGGGLGGKSTSEGLIYFSLILFMFFWILFIIFIFMLFLFLCYFYFFMFFFVCSWFVSRLTTRTCSFRKRKVSNISSSRKSSSN
jgi:hypothetical protein